MYLVGIARLRDGVLAASKVALERMEASRKVFLKGRALALAQRTALYARDELNMSTLRIRVSLQASLRAAYSLHTPRTYTRTSYRMGRILKLLQDRATLGR